MTLTDIERDSPLWRKLKAHLEERLGTLRRKNDTDLNTDETAKLRGRISEVKNLLSLGDPNPAIVADSIE